MTTQEAHKALGGTVSSEKNEILFSRFDINYNALDPIYRRGSIILREPSANEATSCPQEQVARKAADTARSTVSA